MNLANKTEESVISTFISKIIFNNGQELSINRNDIVLFVGPNNAGKSQALLDLYARCKNNLNTIVLKDIEITKGSEGSLIPLIKRASYLREHGSSYKFILNNIEYEFNKTSGDSRFRNLKNYGDFTNLLVCKLNTSNRLSICSPAKTINRNDSRSSPIHYASFDYEYAHWLSENFYKAFGSNLTANILNGQEIPLCIGPTVSLTNIYNNELERQIKFADILDSYKKVHLQGDGIKSFTGILLYLMLDYYRTYLIDEPESFLHPPQARIMGQIIGNTLKEDQQAFISTHSEEIIKGLLDVCSERLKVVRITRNGDSNSFSILDNEKVKSVFADPLLKYSNIMSSLFHKTVILCESDSDCKFYSLIEEHLKLSEGKYSESLFIQCGGKDRMTKIAKSLLSLEVDVRLIPDIDILDRESLVKDVADTFGIDWQNIEKDYRILSSDLKNTQEKIIRNIFRNNVNRIIDATHEKFLSSKEVSE